MSALGTTFDSLRMSARSLGRVYDEDRDADASVSEGFRDSCDSYAAMTFMCELDDRTLMVTVEDVTIKAEEVDEVMGHPYGRCDSCGAPCDAHGCTRDREHVVALDGDS
jgi:hypothetical protein